MTGITAGRDRRAFSIAAAALLVLLLVRFVVVPSTMKIHTVRSGIGEQERLLAGERTLLARSATLPARIEAAFARDDEIQQMLLVGATSTAAQAALAQVVDSLADQAMVDLSRVEPVAKRSLTHDLVALPLRIEGESDLHGLLEFVALLENGLQAVTIEDVAIQRRGAADPRMNNPALAEVVSFRMIATGYTLDDAHRRKYTANAAASPKAGPQLGAFAEAVTAIVDRNLFRADRSAATMRYQVGFGAQAPPTPPAEPPRPPVPEFRLAGVVSAGAGKGLAAITMSGAGARLLNVGDTIGGFRLVAVTGSGARLARTDTTITLALNP